MSRKRSFSSLVPEVAGAVAGWVLRVPAPQRTAPGSLPRLKGRKRVVSPGKPRGHVDLFRVGGEVDEGSLLETEERCVRVAVLLVLADRAAPRLPSHRVLQLAGGDGYAIEREEEVDLVAPPGVTAHLARDRQLVAFESLRSKRAKALGLRPEAGLK